MTPAGRWSMIFFCAWILWSHQWGARYLDRPWTIVDSFETYTACKQKEAEYVEFYKEWHRKSGADWLTELRCLPDTVKPQ